MKLSDIWDLKESSKRQRLSAYTWFIILTGVFLTSGLWIYVCYQINYDYDRAIAEASTETMNLAIAFEEHERRIVANADKDLLKLKYAYERDGGLSQVVNDYIQSIGGDALCNQIAIYNEEGFLVESFIKGLPITNYSDREYFQFQRDSLTDTLFIGSPIKLKNIDQNTIPLSRRIDKPDGTFGGIVYVGLKTDYFFEFYNKMELGQDQLTMLVGMDGIVRMRRVNDDTGGGGLNFKQGSSLWSHLQTGRSHGTYITNSFVDGSQRIISYRVMPDYPLAVVVGKSGKGALLSYEQREKGYIIGALLSSLFLLIFCSLLIKRMEKQLYFNTRFREQAMLLDGAHDYIMVRDLSSQVVYWNQGAEEGYGFTNVEAKGRVSHELLQTEFPGNERDVLDQLLAAGYWEGELRHTRKDGKQIIVESKQTVKLDEMGNPVAIMEINRDITEKRKADEKLQELNVKLQSFNVELENTVIQRTMELQDINATLEEEVMERQISQAALSQLNGELTDLNAALEEEIMERQGAEQSLVKAKEEAERANAAKSKFLANMSHEIRTPMNGIIGMTDITLMTKLEDKQREYLNVVKSSTMSLLRVLNDILDYSKIEAGKIELEEAIFDVWETTNEVIELFTIAAEQKGLSIALHIDKDIPRRIIGDSVRLRQVLSNLVGNGVKFTFEGQIVIDIRITEKYEDKIKLQFVVSDTGIGIADDKLDKLFKRFSQIDDSHTKKFGGTGLGLAISQKLIEIMDGEIGVESKEGVGSRFFFTAIFGIDNEVTTVTGELADQPIVLHKEHKVKTILLAEDDLVSRNMVTIILEGNDFKVIAVENGRDAVEAFDRGNIDLILMDINMPYLDGYTATIQIRAREKHKTFSTPIIAMTAYALKGDREKCLAVGMDDYISKPINKNQLIDMIEKNI